MKVLRLLPLTLALLVPALHADFKFDQSSDITGGAMKGAMKLAAKFSKDAKMPIETTTVVKGKRMAQISPQNIVVTDIDEETITTIDPKKKEYSVVTFEQMREYLKKMSEKTKQKKNKQGADMNFSVSVEPTDNERVINNQTAKETRLKVAIQGTDPQSGQSGAMDMLLQTWGVKPVDGYDEVRDFYKEYGEKLNWMPDSALAMFSRGNPDAQEAMAEMYEELASGNSMPLLQVVSMGTGDLTTPAAESEGDAGNQAAPEDIGRALKKSLGGFGGFGRKKKQKNEQQEAEQQPARTQRASAAGGSKLMEMTITFSGYSNAPVAADLVDNKPAGYKLVKSQIEKALR